MCIDFCHQKNLINNSVGGYMVCKECGKINNYNYVNYTSDYGINDQIKKNFYKRLTYINILLNNINLY